MYGFLSDRFLIDRSTFLSDKKPYVSQKAVRGVYWHVRLFVWQIFNWPKHISVRQKAVRQSKSRTGRTAKWMKRVATAFWLTAEWMERAVTAFYQTGIWIKRYATAFWLTYGFLPDSFAQIWSSILSTKTIYAIFFFPMGKLGEKHAPMNSACFGEHDGIIYYILV